MSIALVKCDLTLYINQNLFITRADSDGLSEQKRLEGLITRYKALIPVIETTMVKIDIYTKAYSFREEIKKVKYNHFLIDFTKCS